MCMMSSNHDSRNLQSLEQTVKLSYICSWEKKMLIKDDLEISLQNIRPGLKGLKGNTRELP